MCYFMKTAESEDPPSDLVPVQPDNKYSATTNLSMILREDIKKPGAESSMGGGSPLSVKFSVTHLHSIHYKVPIGISKDQVL